MSDQGVRFLAEIRRAGMDILFPQIKHDKVRRTLCKQIKAVGIKYLDYTSYDGKLHISIYNKFISISGFVYHIRGLYTGEGDSTQGIN